MTEASGRIIDSTSVMNLVNAAFVKTDPSNLQSLILLELGSRPAHLNSAGPIEMWNESLVPGAVRRETIRVGKRVQHLISTGNGMPVNVWSKEDFPDDWSPTITSFSRQ